MKTLYQRNAENTYNSQKLDTIQEPAEIEALQLGVNATQGWVNYAKSYGKLPAYTRYKAFIAGYDRAMMENENIVTKIKALKAS